jgi:hypothetical protein
VASAVWAPGENGPSQPSTARIRDYWLGGSHHTDVDVVLADQIVVCAPHLPYGVRIHREFLHRVVTYLVNAGVRQFIDLGSGVPTVGNVHEVAQSIVPECRVVYVDLDPVVVAEGRELLTGNEDAVYVQADLRRPDLILANPDVSKLIDPNEPVAVLLVDVLHFVSDSDDPRAIVAAYVDSLCPGSYLAISHMGQDDGVIAAMDMFSRMYGAPLPELTFRGRDEIRAFCAELDLVEPGIVPVTVWRSDSSDPSVHRNPEHFYDYGLLARKP